MYWQGVRDKEGKILLSERDMFDYIEEQCGWQVMNEVKNNFELVEDLEAYAKKHDCHVINVTSSITSKPFFESKGYTVIEEQINERRGERLLRYLMEKKI